MNSKSLTDELAGLEAAIARLDRERREREENVDRRFEELEQHARLSWRTVQAQLTALLPKPEAPPAPEPPRPAWRRLLRGANRQSGPRPDQQASIGSTVEPKTPAPDSPSPAWRRLLRVLGHTRG